MRGAPSFGRRQFDTLRLLLLKVAALVGQSVRRVTLQLPAAFPMAEVFVAVARAIRCRRPQRCVNRSATARSPPCKYGGSGCIGPGVPGNPPHRLYVPRPDDPNRSEPFTSTTRCPVNNPG